MELSNDIPVLHDLIRTLLSRLSVLESKVQTLEAENLELRDRLGLDSTNSHKPPSSDGYKKKTISAALKKEKADKKVGGQSGHQGHHLEMSQTPDKVLVHQASCCSCCGNILSETHYKGIHQKRQVFDMPDPKLYVTEHQTAIHFCCGKQHLGSFPTDINAAVQYGVNLQTLCTVLTNDCCLSYDKASQLLSDLYDCSLNVSTIYTANTDLYEELAPVEEMIKEELLQSEVVHFDETGMRVEGKTQWFHTSCNLLWAYIFVNSKRGGVALSGEDSLLPSFQNWAIHDCWASYFHFQDCKHGICNAHILRELQALIDGGSFWAGKMHKFLLDLYEKSEKGTSIAPNSQQWLRIFDYICAIAHKEEPTSVAQKRGKPKNTKGRNLLNRLKTHWAGVLAFALHKAVPFTNNCAEQAIRQVKIKQKVSMCFRTLKGAKMYARIQGVITTIRKHKMNVFQTIKEFKNKKTIVFKIS